MSAPAFGRVDEATVDRLAAIVGAAGLVRPGPDLAPYGRDETEDLDFPPEVAVRPRTTDQVAAVLALATERRLPVTPRGGGTGLSGGALPVRGGIVLSLERMDRIHEVDEADLCAVVEPGVVTERLHDAVEAKGLFYPPDPASKGSCTIGGNIAENAGGPRAVKYGVTRDWILALTAVLADGRVIETGGRLRKDVAGYDLTRLLVGSEGTLAVVTRAVVRLVPLPAHRRSLLATYGALEPAVATVAAIYRRRVVPCAVEFMEGDALRAAASHLGRTLPGLDAVATLLVSVDGMDAARVDAERDAVVEACVESGATDVVLAATPQQERDLWSARRAIGEAVRAIGPYKEEDTVVPPRRLPELVAALQAIAARHRLRLIAYGHVGDGNVHANLVLDDPDPERRRARFEPAVREIFEATIALGGSITGEHGVGWVQRNYLPMGRSPAFLDLLRGIKRVFDPLGILNPDKVLPDA